MLDDAPSPGWHLCPLCRGNMSPRFATWPAKLDHMKKAHRDGGTQAVNGEPPVNEVYFMGQEITSDLVVEEAWLEALKRGLFAAEYGRREGCRSLILDAHLPASRAA